LGSLIKQTIKIKIMEVKIWSDIRCPFCYIGKRKFEKALEKFPHKDKVKVIWQSFELDPNLKTNTTISAIDHLADIKGMSKSHAEEMQQHIANIAKEVGLDFNSKKMIVANSFNAHRLIQLAKTKGLGNEIEEALFEAYFVEGKNIDDKETLIKTGASIGLDESDVRELITSDAFTKEVRQDEMQAQSLGINGVPFFVLNNKYAVSGAQSTETFSDVLEQTWEEFEKENPALIITEGESCSIDGNCN
jgi:predicted DsbA family dithiol-disulfide isomerase